MYIFVVAFRFDLWPDSLKFPDGGINLPHRFVLVQRRKCIFLCQKIQNMNGCLSDGASARSFF